MRTQGSSPIGSKLQLGACGIVFAAISVNLAHATASFSCATAEKIIPAVSFEGHAPYSDNDLLDFSGEIEIEAGRKIALAKSDVKNFVWKKTMAFGIRKQVEPGAAIEIEIRTRKSPDGIEFPGRYKIRAGKQRFAGEIACSCG